MNFENDIVESIAVLKQGGLILYPTDTIWGIGCDATNELAVSKIFSIKKREDHKSMIMLVADKKEVLQYIATPDLSLFDYLDTIAKPTTVIYDNAIGIASNLIGQDGSIAIRICKDEFCRHLIKRFRKPIVSTSANISGESSPPFYGAINSTIIEAVDYTVHYRRDEMETHQPSAIIKWHNGKLITIRN